MFSPEIKFISHLHVSQNHIASSQLWDVGCIRVSREISLYHLTICWSFDCIKIERKFELKFRNHNSILSSSSPLSSLVKQSRPRINVSSSSLTESLDQSRLGPSPIPHLRRRIQSKHGQLMEHQTKTSKSIKSVSSFCTYSEPPSSPPPLLLSW